MSLPNIAAIDAILADLRVELLKACAKHPPFPTCHHGHSVILEELEELWDEIKADNGQRPPARKEALQVATTAVRYIHDLCSIEVDSAR